MQAATNCLGDSVAVTRQFIKVIHPKFPLILKNFKIKGGQIGHFAVNGGSASAIYTYTNGE